MAMKTSYLIGLLIVGFILLLAGFPWWLGIGIIVLSMAAAVSGDSEEPRMVPVRLARPQVAAAGPPKPVESEPAWKKYQEKEPTGSVNDPMHFRPTMPPDGVAGLKAMSQEKGTPSDNLSIGGRTGTMSMYMDNKAACRIRVKDDLRIMLPFTQVTDENGIKPFTNLFTSHFRTGNPILKTKPLESTFETWKTGFDEWAKEDDS
jgi:hypothetical protein